MRINIVGAFIRNYPFGTELAFKRGFERLGVHRVTYIDPSYPDQEWDMDADVTVVFKTVFGMPYDYSGHLARCSGKKFVYQPDDLRFPHIQDMMREMLRLCDYALTFDADGADLAVRFGYKNAHRLPVTADDELYKHIPGVTKDVDLTFVGSMTGAASHASRRQMVEVLRRAGLNVLVLSDYYDINGIVQIYNRSKVVLNHATDVGQPFGRGYGFQCRHFEAGFTRTPVLSNVVLNECAVPGIVEFQDEGSLVRQAERFVRDDAFREEMAAAVYDSMNTQHRPEHRALQMVDLLGSL